MTPSRARNIAIFAAWLAITTTACRGGTREELPKLGVLPAFSLEAHTGAPFTKESFGGHVTIVSFIFTSCPTICPLLTEKASALHASTAPHGDRVRFVSISVDPENDTPPVLAAYAKKRGADSTRWDFVTGDIAAIRDVVVQGFKLHLGEKQAAEGGAYDIMHASHFVLVDRDAVIRGYYPSDEEGMSRLRDDAAALADASR